MDGLLHSQTAATIRRVLAPKLDGAANIMRSGFASASVSLTLFSSIASLLGNAGQANYSAANAAVDALASHQHSQASSAPHMHPLIINEAVTCNFLASLGRDTRSVPRLCPVQRCSSRAIGDHLGGTTYKQADNFLVFISEYPSLSLHLGILNRHLMTALYSDPFCSLFNEHQ